MEQNCGKHSACNNCKYSTMEQENLSLMWKMNDIESMYEYYYWEEEEEEYEEIKDCLEYYMNVVERYLKDDVSGYHNYCNDCKSKERVDIFKRYLDKMIKIISSEPYYHIEKLKRIYFLQDKYRLDCWYSFRI